MGSKTHDLVVIGGGPGGYVAAIRATQLGMNVGIVDDASRLGGTCLRVGCIPSKALLESSERFWAARKQFAGHGIEVEGLRLNLATMMKRKDQIVKTLATGVNSLLKKNGVACYSGHGRFDGPGRLVVDDEGGELREILESKHFIIATGSKPAPLKGVAWDGDRVGSSTEALSYESVPEHLVVVGAGYIGLELGSVWRRLGAKVTVLEYLDRILPGMDGELAGEAQKVFQKQGLEFVLKARVERAERVGDGTCEVQYEGGDAIPCDRVLIAVGRQPNTDNLGLESIGVDRDKRGAIVIDRALKTTAEGVYAIGDVVRGPMLAHKAEEEGVAVAEQLAGHGVHVDFNLIPGVVYTHPEIASVGQTEEALREAGVEFRKGVFPFAANGRARGLGETDGRVKVLAEASTDRVVGVHIIGPRAGDLIAEATAAMTFGASSEDIARCVHAHPTLAESLKEAALAVDGRAIHS